MQFFVSRQCRFVHSDIRRDDGWLRRAEFGKLLKSDWEAVGAIDSYKYNHDSHTLTRRREYPTTRRSPDPI